MTTSEIAPLFQVPVTPETVTDRVQVDGWRQPLPENQDPFVILAGLDPASKWETAAADWSARAKRSLESGKELEISFQDSFLRALVGATGLVIWRQAAASNEGNQRNVDPGLALLRENRVIVQPQSGLHQLYIPSSAISNLRTRVFADCRPVAGGKPVSTSHHIVDLQIKTAANKPIAIFSPGRLNDGSKLRSSEHQGSWFSFPLEQVQLTLV